MKKLVIFLLALGAILVGLYKVLWKLSRWIIATAPVPLTVWIIVMISVYHWPASIIWALVIVSFVSCWIWFVEIVQKEGDSDLEKRLANVEQNLSRGTLYR